MAEHADGTFLIKARLAALAVLAGALLALWGFSGFFERLELSLYDLRLNLSPRPAARPEVVLLDIDDASVARLGKWPWDRAVHAKAMQILAECGVSVVAWDVVFHGEGSPAGDAALAKALAGNGRVLLPVGLKLADEPEPVALEAEAAVVLEASILDLDLPQGTDLYQARRAFLPLPALAGACLGLGQVSALPDADGVLRSIPILVRVNGRPFPSLDLAAVLRLLGAKAVRLDASGLTLAAGDRQWTVPLEYGGEMLVDYAGPLHGTFARLSYHRVVEAASDPAALEGLKEALGGKLVLVGLVASGTTDFGITPPAGREPLVSVHANAVNALLSRSFLHRLPAWLDVAAAAVLALALAAAGAVLAPWRSMAAGLGLVGGYAALNWGLFAAAGLVMNLAGVLWTGLSVFLVRLGYSALLLREEGERERRVRLKLEGELSAAAKIQAMFWPKTPSLPGAGFFAHCLPAAFVGGDLYDVLALPDGSHFFYVADVSGKGLPAALVMAATWSRFRAEAFAGGGPAEIAFRTNAGVFDLLARDGAFVTFLLARYEPDSGRVQYVNGGHMPPFLVGPEGSRPAPATRGLPLGVFEDARYQVVEVVLEPGESMVVVSDGVTEAENVAKDLFGDERSRRALAGAGEPPRGPGLVAAVADWRTGVSPNDDTTVLEIWREKGQS